MSKITKIALEGFKGITVDQKFTGKDIIVGPNGSGKTARLKALMVAILGYDPSLGKRPMDTMRIASGNKMTVTVDTDTGFCFSRSFERSGSGAIEQTLLVDPNLGEKNPTQCQARVLKELGDFPVMWNLNEFHDMSPEKKKDFIFNLADADLAGWDKYKVQEQLAKKHGLVEGMSYQEPLRSWVQKTMDLWKEGQPVQLALGNMIAYLKDQKSFWIKKESEGQAAQTKLIELKAEYEDETSEPIADTKKAIEDIQEQLIQIREQVSKDTEKTKQANDRFIKINQLKEKIKSIQADIPSHEEKPLDELEKELTDARSNYTVLADLKTGANEESVKAQAEYNTRKDLIVSLANHTVNKSCPISPDVIKCDQNFESVLKEANEKNEVLFEKIRVLRVDLSEYTRDLSILEKQGNALAENIETYKLNMSKRESIAGYEKDLQELQKEDIGHEGIADPEMLKIQQQGLATRLAQKKAELESKDKIKHALAVANGADMDKQKAVENLASVKTLIKLLGSTGIQGDVVSDITGPLADILADLVKGINPNYDFIFDLGTEEKPGFDLICMVKKSWVKFDSLSDGESVIFSAALATALTIQKNPACKILCLEAGECDENNIRALLKGLEDLSKNLDNIIVATHNIELLTDPEKGVAPKGWTVCPL